MYRFLFLLTVLLWSPHALSGQKKEALSPANAAVLLDEMAKSWDRHWEGAGSLTVQGRLNQSQSVDSVNLPAQPVVKGQFQRIDVADVVLRFDIQQGASWCRWITSQAPSWIDFHGEQDFEADGEGGNFVTVLTTKEYLYQHVGSRLQSVHGGLLPNQLQKLDEKHQRMIEGGTRRIVFRNTAGKGRSFRERGKMLTVPHLVSVFGNQPAQFLRTTAKAILKNQGENSVVSIVSNETSTLAKVVIEQEFRSRKDQPPSLTVVTNWSQIQSTSEDSATWFVESATMKPINSADGQSRTKSYSTTWDWQEFPSGTGSLGIGIWEFSVTTSGKPKPDFYRRLEFDQWDTNTPHPTSQFSIWGLDVDVGDLIYDKELEVVTYVGSDGQLVDTGPVVRKTPDELSGSIGVTRGSRVVVFTIAMGVLFVFIFCINKLRAKR